MMTWENSCFPFTKNKLDVSLVANLPPRNDAASVRLYGTATENVK
jgi:hypothetical protein